MTEHVGNAVGQQLGKYRLQRLLGTGGFADVYLGEHLHLGTLAAIKILHTRLAGEEVASFRKEARIIAHLSHPNIIRVFDFDVEDMAPYLIMDYAPGGTLRQRHPKKTQVPLATIIRYVKQIAAGLQYAHEQKLIHRDIKPENMLIDQRGNILISDFGVASAVHSTKSQSVVEMAGTLPYIAPEQLQGLPRPASDQYALAVVVYEWISGERPFQGTFAEIVSQHIAKIPARLCGRFPQISPAVESVIFKAMAKEPRDRFTTIQEFANALEQAFLGETTIQPRSSIQASADDVESLGTQQANEKQVLSAPDTPYFTSTPHSATMPAAPQEDAPAWYANTPPSYPSTLNQPEQGTPLPVQAMYSGSQMPSTKQSYLKPRGPLLAIITVLLVVVLAGGVLGALHEEHLLSLPTDLATPTVDTQATAVQQAVIGTQTAVVRATTTALASTPEGLYSLVTSQQPTFSDSLAEQTARSWDTNSSCAFIGSNYIASSPPGHFAICSATSMSNICNLGYQVQMTALSGDGGGLIFRQGQGDGYRWRVSPDGTYDLVNNAHPIAQGSSNAIQKGLNVSNQLTIIARGSTINLYINSQYVTSVTDTSFSCGGISLMGIGFNDPGKTAFSKAKVWVL